MKKRNIILIALLLVSGSAFAQTKDLSIDSVFTISGAQSAGSSPVNYQVPTGKIWKVEQMLLYTSYRVRINGFTVLQSSNFNGPLWLGSKDIVSIENIGATGSTTTYTLSIIQFILK